jgi:predicted DNA-binding transcriptional regulator AlpA
MGKHQAIGRPTLGGRGDDQGNGNAPLGTHEEGGMRMSKRLLSIPETAEYIGHAPSTLRNQLYRGELPFPYNKRAKKVLVDQRDLDRWIDRLPRRGGRQR